MTCIHICPCNRKFTYFIHIWLVTSKVMISINVVLFAINGFKFGMYSLKVALSCQNMSEWSDCNVVCIVSACSWYIKCKYLSLVSISFTVNMFGWHPVTKCVNYIIGFGCINEWKLYFVLKYTTPELLWMSCIDVQINWVGWHVTGSCECRRVIGLIYDRLQCGEDLELRKRILKEYLEQYVGVIIRQSITTRYFMYLI